MLNLFLAMVALYSGTKEIIINFSVFKQFILFPLKLRVKKHGKTHFLSVIKTGLRSTRSKNLV